MPKLAAAIMTGTMASPSRPSVRFTALPAPTMTNAPKITKNQPKLSTTSLRKGIASEVEDGVAAEPHQRVAGGQRDHRFDQQPQLAGEAAMGLLRHLQIVVVEADEAEAERHREHDPDIGIERIGPQQRRDHEAGQDHQPAHRRRALLGDQMRLRAVGADRLALALAQPQMIDDPGPEQEHEQRARHHRAAGAEGDVAKHVEERRGRRQNRERCWKARSASKTFR